MDHAWDVLGDWVVEIDLPERELPIQAALEVTSWDAAELVLDAEVAGESGLPTRARLQRASDVHRTDAGGGALQWVFVVPSERWSLETVFWPGAMHLQARDVDETDDSLFVARAKRAITYYQQKYPESS
jgi:hypothetical protein